MIHNSSLVTQLAHALDTLAELSEHGDQEDVVFLGKDFCGEGTLFWWGEEGELGDEGVDVS